MRLSYHCPTCRGSPGAVEAPRVHVKELKGPPCRRLLCKGERRWRDSYFPSFASLPVLFFPLSLRVFGGRGKKVCGYPCFLAWWGRWRDSCFPCLAFLPLLFFRLLFFLLSIRVFGRGKKVYGYPSLVVLNRRWYYSFSSWSQSFFPPLFIYSPSLCIFLFSSFLSTSFSSISYSSLFSCSYFLRNGNEHAKFASDTWFDFLISVSRRTELFAAIQAYMQVFGLSVNRRHVTVLAKVLRKRALIRFLRLHY